MATDKSKIAPKPNINTWADRVKVTDSSTRFTLDPVPRNDDGRTPEITADMLTENAEQWDRCMEDQMQAILERGPWMFGGKTMILQQWHPQFIFDKNRISKLPVWVRIHDAALPFITQFELKTPISADPLHIEVEFEWKPARCEKCRVFRHACTGGTVTGANEASRTTDQVHGTVTANQIVVRKESNEGKHTLRKESTPKSLPSQNQTHGNQQPRGNHTLKVLMKDNTETTKGGKGERTTETTQEGKGERTTNLTHSRTDGDPLAN
ncbi:hypothetical protein OIU84_026380 [Salix udensis]|uniref:DUF4283 domain-containing protein n=1 Tax=Salix udensis TaxID=889485 RepID=A0AAD6PDH9_9ROSI|nr:hypothetical protein OIU84_026380 [Salix udensis]